MYVLYMQLSRDDYSTLGIPEVHVGCAKDVQQSRNEHISADRQRLLKWRLNTPVIVVCRCCHQDFNLKSSSAASDVFLSQAEGAIFRIQQLPEARPPSTMIIRN